MMAERGRGRPSKYRAEYAEMARKFCLLGATNADLAEMFEVDESTIDRWISVHKEFRTQIKKGRAVADARVAEKLYHRAVGYEHEDEKIFNNDGDAMRVKTIKHYPPDTVAGIFWLKNRQRDKWRDTKDMNHAGQDGGPLEITCNLILVDPDEDGSKED